MWTPTVFENYCLNITELNCIPEFRNKQLNVNLTLCDTAGQEDFERLRLLSYNNVDIIIVCFSVVKPESFLNVKEIWLPEIEKHCPNAKLLLVGTKKDLKEDSAIVYNLKREGKSVISQDRARKFIKEMNAVAYIGIIKILHLYNLI
jgi:small GTP-binding protein